MKRDIPLYRGSPKADVISKKPIFLPEGILAIPLSDFPGIWNIASSMLPFSDSPEPARLDDAEFSERLADLRSAMRAYVISILPHPDAADDVVQETCLFLWERRDSFAPGTNFKAWAFKSAYFKALAQRREFQRNKVVTLSEEVIHRIAGAAEQRADHADQRMIALERCLRELPPQDLRLLQLKYVQRHSISDQAHALGVPPNRLHKILSRLRLALRHCIESRLSR